MQIPKEAMILLKGIGLGIVYWCGGVLALFGIACLFSKRLRDWAEGKEPQKEWKRGGWWYRG